MELIKIKNKQYFRCSLPYCESSTKHNPMMKFIKFPKLGTIRYKLWCDLTNLTHDKKYTICYRHFKNSDFGNSRLKKNAVPSLCLNDNDDYDKSVHYFTNRIDSHMIDNCNPGPSTSVSENDIPLKVHISENPRRYDAATALQITEHLSEFELLKTPTKSKKPFSMDVSCSSCQKYIKSSEHWKKKYFLAIQQNQNKIKKTL